MTSPSPIIYPPLAWLEAEDNRFGIRLLDVRGLTQAWTASSQDSKTTAAYQRLRSSQGEHCPAETRDWPAGLACDLVYPPLPGLKPGAVFSSREMEDKWDVFLLEGWLYFCRSWTGTPIFRAEAQVSPAGSLRLSRLDFNPAITQEPELTLATVDFLVKSLLFGLQAPVQVPRRALFHTHAPAGEAGLVTRPEPGEHANEPEEVAKYLFHEYGQRGCFATLADTTCLPVSYERATLLSPPFETGDPRLLAEIQANRPATRRPPCDPLDDELTWNLFRSLESSRMLEIILSSMHGGPLSGLQVLYWGWDGLEKRTWAAFKAAARAFGETPVPGAAPDVIVRTEEALFFILARVKGSLNYSARQASVGSQYTSAAAGWYGKVMRGSFETVAVERKKFELLRAWLIGSRLASQAGRAFYLVTLSPDPQARQMEGDFGSQIVQSEERALIGASWGQFIQFIDRSGPPTLENQRLAAYLENAFI